MDFFPESMGARALKCIFVRYSQTQKGYKLYHPITRKVLITKDVTFDEKNFFYRCNNISESKVAREQEVMSIPLPLFLTIENTP